MASHQRGSFFDTCSDLLLLPLGLDASAHLETVIAITPDEFPFHSEGLVGVDLMFAADWPALNHDNLADARNTLMIPLRALSSRLTSMDAASGTKCALHVKSVYGQFSFAFVRTGRF